MMEQKIETPLGFWARDFTHFQINPKIFHKS